MPDAIVQLCCCVFYKAFLTDPLGSSQELTLRAAIAILGSVSSRQLLFHVHVFNFLEERVRGMYDFIWSHVRSMTCVPATRDPLDPFGTIFVNCPYLWLTCSTRHLSHSSLITVDQACAPSAKTVACGVGFWQIFVFFDSSFDSGGGLDPAGINFSGASAKTMFWFVFLSSQTFGNGPGNVLAFGQGFSSAKLSPKNQIVLSCLTPG